MIAFTQNHSSLHESCSGPFRFSIWLKIPAELKPQVVLTSTPQDTRHKADRRTAIAFPTGKTEGDFREYAGNILTSAKTADLTVSLRTLQAASKNIPISVKGARMRPIVIPGDSISVHQVNALGVSSLFLPNETPGAELIFRNPTASKFESTLECKVFDYFGKECKTLSFPLCLPAMSLTKQVVSIPGLDKLGFYAVECSWKTDGKPGKCDFSFVRLTPPPKHPERLFGITFIGETYPHGKAMRRLGVGTKGILMAWRWTERPDGSYDWSGIDRAVADCVSNGIRIIGGFENASHLIPGAYKPKKKPAPNAKLEDVFGDDYFKAAARFEKAALERYGKYIQEWTYGCEINLVLGNNSYETEHYVRRIRQSVPDLRKAKPDIIITGIGVSGGDGRDIPRFKVTRMLWSRLHDMLDGISPDQYTMPSNFGPGNQTADSESGLMWEIMNEAKSIIGQNNRTHLAIGEKGYHIKNELPMNNPHAREMANILAREYVIGKALNLDHWLYYGWQTWREGGEYDYGIWKGPSPRHPAAAYAATARTMLGARFVRRSDLHKNVPLYVFTKGNYSLAALWRSGRGKSISMMLDLPGDTRILDVQGNLILAKGGRTTLELNDAPIYILTATPPDKLISLLKSASLSLPELQMSVSIIDKDTLTVAFANQTNEKLDFTATAGGTQKSLSLSPMEIKQVVFPAGKALAQGETVKAITAKGFVYAQEARFEPIPIRRVRSIGELKKASPTFRLDKPAIHLSDIDYAANRVYNGLSDCSADVRVGYDSENLYLHVLVNDDIHSNEFTERVMTWAGDCVQFAFDSKHDAKHKRLQRQNIFYDDDYIFTAALVQKEIRLINEGKPAWKSDYVCTIARNESAKQTEYTIVIPLKSIPNLPARSGSIVGFNLIVMDCDAPRETAKYWMQLTRGIAGGQNPSAFKCFIFE